MDVRRFILSEIIDDKKILTKVFYFPGGILFFGSMLEFSGHCLNIFRIKNFFFRFFSCTTIAKKLA
jgi:hypothetical protein